MLFNTVDFAIFLPIVLILYWSVFNKNLKTQNLFLVAVSYFFYGCWDWRFLGLIFLSSMVDFYVAKKIDTSPIKKTKQQWLLISIIVNIGVLGFFKYYNFFITSFNDAFLLFGTPLQMASLQIILPVGISFYTFQTLSYTIDVYRGKLKPTNSMISFFAFVSFFPQLVAGPIERATNLLPQFFKKRTLEYHQGVLGLKLILIGLFKKMVIADNCAKLVNEVFQHPTDYNGSTLFIGAVFFAFQIYGDFSGYSDIAIGTAKLMGFDLMKNFNLPYLSRNLGEFWRRWHISLSTWFRDYVYIPLGGSKTTKGKTIRNIFIVFVVSGFWHGANWTFIVWGFLHALFFMPLILNKTHTKFKTNTLSYSYLPTLKTIVQILTTFVLVTLLWVFFRADTLQQAILYLKGIFSASLFSIPQVPRSIVLLLVIYMLIEWLQRDKEHLLEIPFIKYKPIRIGIYYAILIMIFYFSGETNPFIYFQF